MKKSTPLVLWLVLALGQHGFAQKFILQETNVDRKKNANQYINVAKGCQALFLKKQTIATIPISDQSSLTNNAINALSDKFVANLPKEMKPDIMSGKGNEAIVNRDLKGERQRVVKLTYGVMSPNQNNTYNYVQIVVIFDPKSYAPKIDDIKVKTRSEYITFTDKELASMNSPTASAKKR
ncbi:MAG: hypothetical protein QM734_14470 [Cyclobacteriaceae bacterium]